MNMKRTMDEYSIKRTIGKGVYGIVKKAKIKESGEKVAIKKFSTNDPFHRSTIREISTLKACDHPGIISIQDIIIDTTKSYTVVAIVMELMEYSLLDWAQHMSHLCSKDVYMQEVKKTFRGLANAVAYLHHNHLIHRDIKPANILMDGDNTKIKLCDFGLVSPITKNRTAFTDDTFTILYRPIELLLGHDYDQLGDVWSMGCVFMDLINHGRPWNKAWDQYSVFQQILELFGPITVENYPNLVINECSKSYQTIITESARIQSTPLNQKQYKRRLDITDSDLSDLFESIFTYDPRQRITAKGIFHHRYLQRIERPTSNIDIDMLPDIHGELYTRPLKPRIDTPIEIQFDFDTKSKKRLLLIDLLFQMVGCTSAAGFTSAIYAIEYFDIVDPIIDESFDRHYIMVVCFSIASKYWDVEFVADEDLFTIKNLVASGFEQARIEVLRALNFRIDRDPFVLPQHLTAVNREMVLFLILVGLHHPRCYSYETLIDASQLIITQSGLSEWHIEKNTKNARAAQMIIDTMHQLRKSSYNGLFVKFKSVADFNYILK